MKNYLRISEVAEQLNVSASAVRKYADAGRISFTLTPNGQRVFTQENVDKFLGKEQANKTVVFYVRTSTHDKKLLSLQQDLLTSNYGEPAHVYADTSSGLNENRKSLNKLLEDAEQGKFTTVCITHKDRLTRFGYTYLEKLLKLSNVEILVLDEEEHKSLHEELLQDFMNLLASFSGKFYRLRGYEQKRALLDKAGEVLEETH